MNTPPTSITLPIKAVPGASKNQIAGILGDRLKVRISAPPENGKANKAICALIAKSLSIKPSMVEVTSGHTNPEKILTIVGSDFRSTQALIDHLTSTQ